MSSQYLEQHHRSEIQAALDLYHRGEYESGLHALEKLARAGCAQASSLAGNIYEWGTPVAPPDAPKAFRHYQAAASGGDLTAHIALGRLYLRGFGVPRDLKTAFYHFTVAESQGVVTGPMLVTLGRMHQFGWGVAPDLAKAEAYYRHATQRGNVYGRRYLGLLLFKNHHYVEGSMMLLLAPLLAFFIGLKRRDDPRLREL